MNSTIERMHTRRTILDLCEAITLLLKTLLVMAQEHKETVIPAYTHHSQQAQPITLGHFYTSCFQMFSRDMERLLESYARRCCRGHHQLPGEPGACGGAAGL